MPLNAHHCYRCHIYYENGGHLECGAAAVKLSAFENDQIEAILSSDPTITRPFVITEERVLRFSTRKKKPLAITASEPPVHFHSQVATSLDGLESWAFTDLRPPGHKMTPQEIDAIYSVAGKYGPSGSRPKN